MNKNELYIAPCPLCGANAEIIECNLYHDHNDITIECTDCGLTLSHTQWYIGTEEWNEGLHSFITVYKESYSKSAIDLWNQRAEVAK